MLKNGFPECLPNQTQFVPQQQPQYTAPGQQMVQLGQPQQYGYEFSRLPCICVFAMVVDLSNSRICMCKLSTPLSAAQRHIKRILNAFQHTLIITETCSSTR